MLVGYARTSTTDQAAGLEAQERDLRSAGCEKIFQEQVSSVAPRAQLKAALDFVRQGDVLLVSKPDRLARSTADLLKIVQDLQRRDVGLIVLSMGDQQLDTRSPTGKLMLTMLGAVAEFERSLMLERQREGIAKAVKDDKDRKPHDRKYKGRKPTARNQAADVAALKAVGVTPTEIAKRLGMSRMSVYRCLEHGAAQSTSEAA